MKNVYIKPEVEIVEFSIEEELTLGDLNPSMGEGDDVEDGIL